MTTDRNELIEEERDAESLRIIEGHHTYAQAHQDLFVRAMLGFPRGGTYLEIGSAEPRQSSNTYILERDLGWRGLSIDLDPSMVAEFRAARSNPCIEGDATTLDYARYFAEYEFPRQVDYLSLDIDPASVTFNALQRLPHGDYRFSVITYEHDSYVSGGRWMELSREYLARLGYVRVVSNVLCCGRDFEDWYVDPRVVSPEVYEPFISTRTECADIFRNQSLTR
jgi:hypothetical protein